MKDLINYTLNLTKIKQAEYADVRLVDKKSQSLSTQNEIVESLHSSESLGIGVRVLKNGAWGFSATNQLDKKNIQNMVKRAINLASASAKTRGEKVKLSPAKKIVDKYKTKIKKDPFKVPLEKKIALLTKADHEMKKTKEVKIARSHMQYSKEEKIFSSTDGSYITQEIIETGCGIEAMTVSGNEVQNRSYPNSHGGQSKTSGYELIEDLNLSENASKIAQEASALLKAKQCPSGEIDLIIDSDQLALQVHESCGHPVELDRVLGYEAGFAGTSFLTLDKLGKFRYGSDIVNINADATIESALGSYGYDDEGIPAQKSPIIKNGILVGYLTSRETAPIIGQKSNGTMRADGFNSIPLIRMTNINLQPGKWSLNDLISDTKYGILMSTNKSWSIDDKRLNFQFGCEIGWEIKNGKIGQILKNPTYTGITPQFWRKCDAICNKDHWQVWGVSSCGKGEPIQLAHVAHGVSPARFRNIKVGVWK